MSLCVGVCVKGVHATVNAFVSLCSRPVVVERIVCPSVRKLSQFGLGVSGKVDTQQDEEALQAYLGCI